MLQLDDIVDSLTVDKWLSMLPAIEDNFNRAKQYGEWHLMWSCPFNLACSLTLKAGNDWDFQFTRLLPQMSSRLNHFG